MNRISIIKLPQKLKCEKRADKKCQQVNDNDKFIRRPTHYTLTHVEVHNK